MRTIFISGHLDLTEAEFKQFYQPAIQAGMAAGAEFIIGDAKGADTMAQAALQGYAKVTVFHMFQAPRNNVGCFPTRGGFTSDASRDEAMTQASTEDLAYVRLGREKSGTAKNVARRQGPALDL